MNKKRKQNLLWLLNGFSGFVVVVVLVLYALSEQANYYYNPVDIMSGKVAHNQFIRAGGLVVVGSVHRDTQNPVLVNFQITDRKSTVNVRYSGILPDLFKENSGVIVEGHFIDKGGKNKFIIVDKVLAKHDENYMPPEIKKSLEAHSE